MNIPTVHTKATFTVKDIQQSSMHFACKAAYKPANKDVWSHAPLKRGNR